jgi:hypothetical protein
MPGVRCHQEPVGGRLFQPMPLMESSLAPKCVPLTRRAHSGHWAKPSTASHRHEANNPGRIHLRIEIMTIGLDPHAVDNPLAQLIVALF